MSSSVSFADGVCTVKLTQQMFNDIKAAVKAETGIELSPSILNLILKSTVPESEPEFVSVNDEEELEQIKGKVEEIAVKHQLSYDEKKKTYSLIYDEEEKEKVEAKFIRDGKEVTRNCFGIIYKNHEMSLRFEIVRKDRKLNLRKPNVEIEDFHLKKSIFELFDILSLERIKLDKFQTRAANYLSYAFKNPIIINDDTNISSIKQFLPHLIGKEYNIEDIPPEILVMKNNINRYDKFIKSKFNKNVMYITILQALFMVELFATNQPENEVNKISKIFLEQKFIYKLAILPVLPVAFELIKDNVVMVSFADTDIISAAEIQKQFKFALNLFKHLKIKAGQFHNVDVYNFDDGKVKTMSENLGYCLIKGENIGDEKSAGFSIWCLPNEIGTEPFCKFEEECQKQYNIIQTFYCEKCNKYVSKGFSGECFIREHTGNRIPFDDGKDIHEEYVQEGDKTFPIELVQFSCCGTIPKHQMNEGCSRMVFNEHKLTEKSNSHLEFVFC